jgi:urea transport system substrate-binding protein
MGVVFDAEDTALQRRVALKVIRPELAARPAARQRFLREARTAASLPHDHIVTIYAVGQVEDVAYLAMQYLEGESLEERLQRVGRLTPLEAVRLGREVAEGLAAAHARGLIHRDVKPANIWLERLPAGPGSTELRCRVRLLDFGLARQVSAPGNLTTSGFIVGTPHYLAPEQARGSDELDGRCDLFALGVVLYRALSGALPFEGDDVLAVLNALATAKPRPLAQRVPGLPHPLCELVHRLLAKDPDDRPPDGHAVAVELEAIERQLVLAGPTPPPATLVLPSASIRLGRLGWRRWAVLGSLVAFLLLNAGFFWLRYTRRQPEGAPAVPPTAGGAAQGEPVKLGLLFPLSGYVREMGEPTNDAALLAVEEVNRQGGVLGRTVQPVVRDGSQDLDYFAEQAEKLLSKDGVCAIVGCWTSASRKAVRPVVERHDSVLLYPIQCEGLEESPNIFYLGAAPNQEVIPAIRHLVGQQQKRRVFLAGVDTVYCRVVNEIIKDTLKDYKSTGAAVVGEYYFPMGPADRQVGEAVAAIRAKDPDLIVNTVGGMTDHLLTRALRRSGVTAKQAPMLSFVMPEEELRGPSPWRVAGDYVACNYFQSIPGARNEEFVRRFRAHYGPQKVLTDPMENAYVAVHLWARAVRKAGSVEPAAVRRALEGQFYDAPDGPMRIDARTHYVWNIIRVAKVEAGGRIRIVWRTEEPVAPEPFPPGRSRAEWEKFLDDLYRKWGNHWEKPDQP